MKLTFSFLFCHTVTSTEKNHTNSPWSASLLLWKMLFPTWLSSFRSHYNTPSFSIQGTYFLKTRTAFPGCRCTNYSGSLHLSPWQGKYSCSFSVSCIDIGRAEHWLNPHPSFSYGTPPLGLLLFPEKGQQLVNSNHWPNVHILPACPQLPEGNRGQLCSPRPEEGGYSDLWIPNLLCLFWLLRPRWFAMHISPVCNSIHQMGTHFISGPCALATQRQ